MSKLITYPRVALAVSDLVLYQKPISRTLTSTKAKERVLPLLNERFECESSKTCHLSPQNSIFVILMLQLLRFHRFYLHLSKEYLK
jgi:hypothetical protein